MTNESGAHAAWTRQHRDDSGHGQEGADAARFHQATVTSTQLKTHKLCISGILFRLLIFRPRLAEGNGNLRTRNCREGGLLSCQVYLGGSEGPLDGCASAGVSLWEQRSCSPASLPAPCPPLPPHTHPGRAQTRALGAAPGKPALAGWHRPQPTDKAFCLGGARGHHTLLLPKLVFSLMPSTSWKAISTDFKISYVTSEKTASSMNVHH